MTRRTSEAMGKTIPSSFPQAIITSILSRLPVKSIVRFKCVSKSLYTLIKTSDFITKHLHYSSQNLFLLVSYYHHLSGSDPGLMLICDGGILHDVGVPFLKGLSCFPRVVGSCNGLICLDVSSCFSTAFVLWNVGTREFKRLPRPLLAESPARPLWMVSSGFGYNPDTDDYMLVRIVSFESAFNDEFQAEVYKRSTGCWEEIQTNIKSCVVSGGQEAVAVKEMLHWMANGVGALTNHKFIVSFDMNQEAFRTKAMPNIATESSIKAITYENSLALAVYPGFRSLDSRFELWVFSDGKFWIKRVIVPVLSRAACPIGSWKDSQLIMKINNKLFLMEPGSRKITILPLKDSEYSFKVYTYVESLASVRGDNENEAVKRFKRTICVETPWEN